jgi:shikimate dehydrogenase
VPLRFAIIGDPVEHSLSPLLHGTAFHTLGIDATYERVRVSKQELPAAWSDHLNREFTGLNVTLPLKEAILPLLDEVDQLAAAVGAVNTVSRTKDRFFGTNTDISGIRHTLLSVLDSIRHRPVAIIGAGGTARSVVAAMAAEIQPSRLFLVVRNADRANGVAVLARTLLSCPVEVLSLETSEAISALAGSRLLVQTTPVGMLPHADREPVPDYEGFHHEQVVFDVIYRPLETSFIRRASQAGCRVLTGLELFLRQGAASFEIWTGRPMPLDSLRPTILAALTA